MEVLVLDGKEYTKAAKAARDLGYTADYVGQLCRSGQVTAHLIGRTWYVNKEELTSHRHEKKRMSRVKAREQAKQSIAEHRAKKETETKNYKNLAISYETDSSDLIPPTRKVEVESEPSSKRSPSKVLKKGPKYEIENKGEKIIMQGKVKIEDASEDAPDPHTTILKPTIISGEDADTELPKKKSSPKRVRKEGEDATHEVVKKPDFMAKLEDRKVLRNQTESISAEVEVQEDATTEEAPSVELIEKKGTWAGVVLLALLLLIGVVVSLPLSRTTTYTAESVVPVTGTFTYDIDKTLKLISENF